MIQNTNIPQKQHDDLLDLVSNVDCGFVKFINDSTTTILYANNFFFTLLGYTRDEYLENFIYHFSSSIHPEDSQKFKAMLARQIAVGNTLHFEYRAFKKDGSLIWIRLHGQLYNNGTISYYCCSCIDITDMKSSYESLSKAKLELDMLANNLPGGVLKICYSDFKIIYANDGFYKLIEFSRLEYEQSFNNIFLGNIHADDTYLLKNKMKEASENRKMLSVEYRIITKSGQIHWFYLNGSQIDAINGATVYLCVIVDITKQKEYETQLTIVQKTQQLLCEFTKETNWEYEISTKKIRRYGKIDVTYSNKEVIYDFITIILSNHIIHPQDIERFKHALQSMKEGRTTIRLEIRVKNYIGIYTWCLIQGSVIFDKYGNAHKVIGKTSNIESHKLRELSTSENQSALHSLLGSPFFSKKEHTKAVMPMVPLAASYDYDSITGLMNFSHFMDAANYMIRTQTKKHLAVISWDMNRFKKYNLMYGFTTGNQLLKMLTDAVLPHLKPGELFSRIHSDHFIMCVTYKTLNELNSRISVFRNNITLINEQTQPHANICVSCGVYLLGKENVQIADAIDKAEHARKSVKKVPGLHNYVIFSEEMLQKDKEKASLSEAFMDAFDNDEFSIYYQPSYTLRNKMLYAADTFIHWKRPGNKLIYPKDFLYLLDSGSNGAKLDFWVIDEICKQLKYWMDSKKNIIPIVINISGFHQDPIDFFEYFEQLVEKYQIDVSSLMLEFDETQFLEEPEALSYLTDIGKKKGYSIILHGFEKLYTCLQLASDFSLDIIKFDFSFFQNSMHNSKEQLLLKKYIELIKESGITIMVKGVNSQKQAEFLKELGCDTVQGALYQEAITPKDFTQFILNPICTL